MAKKLQKQSQRVKCAHFSRQINAKRQKFAGTHLQKCKTDLRPHAIRPFSCRMLPYTVASIVFLP